MILQDFVNLTVVERIEQLEKLAGEELKAFAAEVARQEGALPILGVILRNANTPEALIKRTLKSSLIKLGIDLTLPEVEQEQVASQPTDREIADWNKIKAFKEVAPVQPTEAEKQEFLARFYGEAVVDLDMANPMNGLDKVQVQVRAICEKMTEYGFSNFNALAPKFAEREFDIQGEKNRATVFSNAKQIKILMESILYVVENAAEDNRRRLANTHRDRQFACGEGTLDNLIEIYGEMSLNKQGIAAYIAQQKRQFIREVLSPYYRNNYFAEFAMPFHAGNERHDIPSLTNAIAEEFGLLEVKDKYTKDASAVAKFVSDEVNAAFAKLEAQKAFIEGVAGLLASSLENSVDEGSPDLKNQVQQFLTNLGFTPKYNYNHLVYTEDRMLRDSKHVWNRLVKVFFDESRIVDMPDLPILQKQLDILGSVNSKFEQRITKEVIGELSNATNKNFILTTLLNGLKFDKDEFGEENPFLLLKSKGIEIHGENPIAFIIKKNWQIRKLHPIDYFIENFTADEFAKLNVTKEQLTNALLDFNEYAKPDTVAKLVIAGADVNALSVKGRSPLRIAEKCKLHDIAQVLREKGAESIDIRDIIVKKITDFTNPDVNNDDKKTLLAEIVGIIEKYPFIAKEVIDAEGNNLMHFAVIKKSKEVVEALLKTQAGKESCIKSKEGRDDLTPVVIALRLDLHEILQLFFQTQEGNGASKILLLQVLNSQNPNSSNWLKTFLNTEVGKGRILTSRYQPDGATALHSLCAKGDLEKVKVIMGASTTLAALRDNKGNMPLHVAASNGRVETVKFLLQDVIAAATVTATDNDGNTILHTVHDDCAEILLSRPEVRRLLRSTNDHDGTTPMHIGSKKFVKLALQYPEGKQALSIVDADGCTPLYHYILGTDLNAIEECFKIFAGEFRQKFFLEKDEQGITAWASLASDVDGEYQITQLYGLIETKFPQLLPDFFKIQIDNEGNSFLTYAIRAGNLDWLKKMLESESAKNQIRVKDLMLAVTLGNSDIVKKILEMVNFNRFYHEYDLRQANVLTLDHTQNGFRKFNIEILKALLAVPKLLDSINGNALLSYINYGDFEALDIVLGYQKGLESLFDARCDNSQLQFQNQTLLYGVLKNINANPEYQEQKECLNVIIKALKRCADKDKVAAFLRVQDSQGKTALDLADEETRERLEACEYTLLRKVPALPTGVPSASTSSTAVASTSLQANIPAANPVANVEIEEEVMLVKKRRSERSSNPDNKKRDTTSKDFNKRSRK